MKKDIHSQLYLIKFHCISCQKEYQNYSTLQQEVKTVENCGGCHPFYTGEGFATIKTGPVELFRQRQEKAKKRNK